MTNSDIALVSLGTTPGLRRADAAFQAAASSAGVSCELIEVPIGTSGRLRRQITITDLVEARAARRASRAADARVIVFSAVTTALLQRPKVPYAIRYDSPAALNRPGAAGAWQRRREIRAMKGAAVLLPWGEAAAAETPVDTRTIAMHVPVETPRAAGERDIDALAYAGYPAKRGLDDLMRAWESVGVGRRLVVAGIEHKRAEIWLRMRDMPIPAGVEFCGLLERHEWDAVLGRSRIFVNASRREDHGLSQLEALAAGCMLVTVPSAGPYEALPIARRLEPRFVSEKLSSALGAALFAEPGDYAERAARELEPYRRDSVQRVFEHEVLPALGLR